IAYALGSEQLTVLVDGILVPRVLATDDVMREVQTSTDLINWTPVTTLIGETQPVDGNTIQTFAIPSPGPTRYYRVRLTIR
ncbi:MAG: hypothetical protein ACPGAP_08250, partial [Akkermansiaceae bacterium]